MTLATSHRRSLAILRAGYLAGLLACACTAASALALHPLDPLDAAELAAVRDILKDSGRFSGETHFAWVQLAEPPKATVEAFKGGADFPRQASLDAIDYAKGKSYRVVVDLRARRLTAVDDLGARQPGLDDPDFDIAADIVEKDARFKAALIARGLKIPGRISESVRVQYMPVGIDASLENENGRLVRIFFSAAQALEQSDTGPVLDGLMAVVDVMSRKVIRFHDEAGTTQVATTHDVFAPDIKSALKRFAGMRGPQGERSVRIADNIVTWRNWRLRYGFNQREGLVLHQIGFDDGVRMRTILYRASLSEVLTAYGDPAMGWSSLFVFDEGCLGLGHLSYEVQRGREVPANATLLPVMAPDPKRASFSNQLPGRIYVYERDGGNLVSYREDASRMLHARATELVIGSRVALGNYIYAFNWVFREDGSFAFEPELSGSILSKFVASKECESCAAIAQGPAADGSARTYESQGGDRYGGLVQPNVVGVSHEHWFNLRLDFDLDGTGNAVLERNVQTQQDAHAHGAPASSPSGITVAQTVFGKAAEARRDMNHHTSRSWTIYNPSARGATGRPSGYTLMAMGNAATAMPASREKGSVAFTFHNFWVTPYREGELYAAGAYPNQAKRDDADNLHAYADDSSIYDRDVVVWYSLGDIHVPRPEDFPIISSKRMSVMFYPDGFFARNPVLTAPAPSAVPSRSGRR